MLCEMAKQWAGGSFVLTWLALSALAFTMILLTSGSVFYCYYWPTQVTYEKWTRKSNPRFPSPEKVRDEIVQMLKGMSSAALCPAASLWLAARGKNQAYCGLAGPTAATSGWGYVLATFCFTMVVSDFWEFFYHRLGHIYPLFWSQHKHHHVFFNPSPFAVIADEYLDQLMRASPLLLFPLVMPVNMDMLFFQYGLWFYAYGVYLHWGYEGAFRVWRAAPKTVRALVDRALRVEPCVGRHGAARVVGGGGVPDAVEGRGTNSNCSARDGEQYPQSVGVCHDAKEQKSVGHHGHHTITIELSGLREEGATR